MTNRERLMQMSDKEVDAKDELGNSWYCAEIEKIKSESADYLNGLNSCGVIEYFTYSYAFDFYMDLIDRAYEQGKEDAIKDLSGEE